MPMGSGFNLWEMVDLWKQVRKIWPVFRQAFRKERDAHDARLSAQRGGAMTRRTHDGPPASPNDKSADT